MLEPLFDTELDYRPGMPPLTSDGDGALTGSGDGAVHGPKLTGKRCRTTRARGCGPRRCMPSRTPA